MFLRKTSKKFISSQLKKKTITSKRVIITSISKRTYKSDAQIDIRFRINKPLFKNIKNYGGIRQHTGKYLETYYDTIEDSFPNQPDKWYFLAKQGKWLCTRENQWYLREYKILGPRQFENKSSKDRKDNLFLETGKEAFGEREVRLDLNLQQDWTDPNKKSLTEDLKSIGVVPYAKFYNQITRYAISNMFDITIEAFDFGHSVGKLSTYIDNPSPEKYEKVTKEIIKLIFRLDLDVIAGHQEGIVSYLGRERSLHFRDLLKAGAIEVPSTEERVRYGRRLRMFQKVKNNRYFDFEEPLGVDEVVDMTEEDLLSRLTSEKQKAIQNEIEHEAQDVRLTDTQKKINELLYSAGGTDEFDERFEQLVEEQKEKKDLEDDPEKYIKEYKEFQAQELQELDEHINPEKYKYREPGEEFDRQMDEEEALENETIQKKESSSN